LNIIALGFWISAGLAIRELLKVISIGWLLVAAPFLLGIGISVAIVLAVFVIALLVAWASK
jgi:hypothetical protein